MVYKICRDLSISCWCSFTVGVTAEFYGTYYCSPYFYWLSRGLLVTLWLWDTIYMVRRLYISEMAMIYEASQLYRHCKNYPIPLHLICRGYQIQW